MACGVAAGCVAQHGVAPRPAAAAAATRGQQQQPRRRRQIQQQHQQHQQQQQPHLGQLAAAGALALTALLSQPAAAAAADAAATQLQAFTAKCAGCHAGGGNILQPGATLSQADLSANGWDSPEGLFRIIYSGKGRMPGFGADCAPRGQCTFGPRLSDEDIQALADYVAAQAAAGWAAPQ